MRSRRCAVVALLMTVAPVLAQAADVVVGVNLVDTQPDRQTVAWQEATLKTLRDAGVRVLRTGISNDDKGVDFAQRVHAHGMTIEWLVGVSSRSGNMILSAADPESFRAYFQPLFAKMETKGVVFAGFELGNEINWSNHDLGAVGAGSGKVFGMTDLLQDPKGQQVAKGYRNYTKVLAVLKEIRDSSQLNRRTPIITAGMGDVDPTSARRLKRDAVGLAATIQFLRTGGVDELVDGYGIHWYPEGNATPTARRADLSNAFAECGRQKPCWITEWGLPVSSGKACPVVEVKRIAIFSELRDDFARLARQGRLKGLVFYTWEGSLSVGGVAENNPYGAVICGALTASGRLAVAPM